MSQDDIDPMDQRTALTMLARRVEVLDLKFDKNSELVANALSEVKGEIVAVGATAERTLRQATKTNGRVDTLEDRVDQHRNEHHDAELIALTRRKQREEVRRAVFGLARATENRLVTGVVLVGLVVLGAIGEALEPWRWFG